MATCMKKHYLNLVQSIINSNKNIGFFYTLNASFFMKIFNKMCSLTYIYYSVI